MTPRRRFGRTLRWTTAIVTAVLFHLALFWGVHWTKDSEQSLKRSRRQFTKIKYFDAEARERSLVLDQQMTLFDPRPMVLPTEWNAANAGRLREFIQEEEGIFADFGPMFELEDGNYIDDFGNAPADYDQLAAAQADFDFTLFDEIARKRQRIDYQQELGLEIVLKDTRTGERLSSATIYNNAVDALDAQWPDWGPALLIATVERGFQVAGLAVMQSSGFDEVDQTLRRQAHSYFGELGHLKDGVYLLEITP